ncbi:MAG: UDP-N-acetylmuramoyl-tripeptide--D-alanyl-D-alanine ligase [Proteobacteria bacterium]|nr:UDP-N-acetylmuramoyl-tripeptide--D-alanyl-D-alanine ligase [Pseudomonadota bacterium]
MAARWGIITAGEILSALHGELIGGSREATFAGLSTDSREIIPGSLFLALEGERFDGHDFIGKAVDKGATGVVMRKGRRPDLPVEKNLVVITVSDTLKALGDLAGWWRRQHEVLVAAITGSAGKTTTKEMTASILGQSWRVLKNKGNFNNLVGLPLSLFAMEEGHQRAVLEMGMNRPGEIGRLTEIADPDVGLITNVARAHLEGVGNVMGVAKAKVELLEKMRPEGEVILNGDDDLLMKAAAPLGRKVKTYGMGPGNDITARKIRSLGRAGFSFEVNHLGKTMEIRLRTPGIQNVSNAIAASAVALCLKALPEHIVQGLGQFEGLPGRFRVRPLPGGGTLVDDTYNANPFSLRAALSSLKDLVEESGRILVGLGEMMELEDETVPAHIEAGGMVAELGAHYFVAMGEHAREMIEGALKKGFPPERADVAATHDEMAEKLGRLVRKRDLVFLKGSRRVGLEKVVERLMVKC